MISNSEYEAFAYYAGLPSAPVLVCRTRNTSWKRPTGPGPRAYRVLREAKPVFDHQIATVWDNLGPKVPDCLDSVGVTRTSIDVVRFANVGEDPFRPGIFRERHSRDVHDVGNLPLW